MKYPLIKLLILSIAVAMLFGCDQEQLDVETVYIPDNKYADLTPDQIAGWDESQDLAECLNQSVNMIEAFESCVETESFKYETALELARCVSENRNVSDEQTSAELIEACYE